MSARGEFEIIARHFVPLANGAPLAFGLTDDAALLKPRKGRSLVVTTDAIVEGVHFLAGDPPDQIARKLLRVNLSDLAAKGATPRAYVLTCAFPRRVEEQWIAAFARGLRYDQAYFGIDLIGGDTVAIPGPANFSATLFGEVPGTAMLRRSGARPGDAVCVTGTIGDGGFGLSELRRAQDGLSGPQRRFLIARYRLPQPRTRLGPMLRGLAHASLDVSDGLAQDLGHMAAASGVHIVIDAAKVPLSSAGRAIERGDSEARLRALTSGDDYEIVFAVPRRHLARLAAAAGKARTRVTVIGEIQRGKGVVVLGPNGSPLAVGQGGYDHFGR